MTLAIATRFGRPSWMIPFGLEGWDDAFFDRLWPEWRGEMGEEYTPSMNFSEKEGKYYLSAELPGFDRDEISVTLDNGYVTVSGKKESNKDEEGTDYYIKEIGCGSFTRTFRLPSEVDEKKVDATYKDGVLTVVMPHKEESKNKKIKIN
jgi:HSP20 family protein